jgi:multidrug resistance protein MdtO
MTVAPSQPAHPLAWLLGFLEEELAPYPGRAALVARMVLAATIVMVISMTFRIPYGFQGALYTLLISRESPRSTVRAATTIIVAQVVATAYVLIGAPVSLGDPMVHLLWVVATLFVMFYAISAMTDYVAATNFAILMAITIPLWDLQVSPELKVEQTLWAVGQIVVAGVVTALVELAFAAWRPGDEVVSAVAERLTSVEAFLTAVSDENRVERTETEQRLRRLGMLGTSRLRLILQRSPSSTLHGDQMGAVVALVGRLVDIAATMASIGVEPSEHDQTRMRRVAEAIAGVRSDFPRGHVPRAVALDDNGEAASAVPFLHEMENTLGLMSDVIVGTRSPETYALQPPGDPPVRVFVADALSNAEHVKFGLKGCLAASLCYIIYTAVSWPGISTAVVTCVLTALTTVGASRQKQVLRVAGAIAGAVAAIAAQVIILPHVDSIGGFTLLFVVLTSAAAWIIASGPRLSYFGVQLALAFYLVHLQEFTIQTSLAVGRDRVVGILLGLFIMWIVFDQLWGAPAAVAMKRTFVSSLRLLAHLAREPVSPDRRVAIGRSQALRETIRNTFDAVRALGDSVLFEFGPSRQQDLALRASLVRLQPQLRMVFLTRIGLLKYRLRLPGFELPADVAAAQAAFDQELGTRLDAMADRLEGKTPGAGDALDQALTHLEQVTDANRQSAAPGVRARLLACLSLSRRIEYLTASLDKDVGGGLQAAA